MNPYEFAIGDTLLITADNWFFAPNGKQYRAVFGTVHAVKTDEDALGIKTNARSTNWYVQIGRMLIAGCQIHYAVKTPSFNELNATDWSTEGGFKEYSRPCMIFNADE